MKDINLYSNPFTSTYMYKKNVRRNMQSILKNIQLETKKNRIEEKNNEQCERKSS